MADKKKAETKNQHYVPQFYQRQFSADAAHKTIGTYILSKRLYIPHAPIKSQSSGDYFYSDDQKMETILGEMEKLAAVVIGKIQGNPFTSLSREDEYTIYSFIMMQIGRTLDRANFIQEIADQTAKSILKAYIELQRAAGNEAAVEDLTDDVIDGLKVNLNKPAMFALGQHAQLINTCIDLKQKVLINRTCRPFVTSDNPACMYSMFLERMGVATYALGSRGLMFYLPLSRDVAVMFYDPLCYKLGHRRKPYVELDNPEDVCNLNCLSACYANETIYCQHGTVTEFELRQLAELHDKYKPKERVLEVEGIKHPDGRVVGAFTNSTCCHLKLSFVAELPQTKAISRTTFNPETDSLRPIAQIKDKLILGGSKNS